MNLTDPSGLFSEQSIRTSVPHEIWNILNTSRIGLYKLLLAAEDGEIIDPLWITIDPFRANYSPAHPIPHESAILECIGGRNIQVRTFQRGQYSPHRPISLGHYIENLEWEEETQITSVYQKGNNAIALRSKWAKQSFTHYYALSSSQFPITPITEKTRYYSDIRGIQSLIPDVVARGLSVSVPIPQLEGSGVSGGVGYEFSQLIDKHGQVYFSHETGYGPDLPSISPVNYGYREGYVRPRSAGNGKETIELAIKAGRVSWNTDVNTDFLGYNTATLRDVHGPYDWGIQGWEFLDGTLPDAVAKTPPNGCNCGN